MDDKNRRIFSRFRNAFVAASLGVSFVVYAAIPYVSDAYDEQWMSVVQEILEKDNHSHAGEDNWILRWAVEGGYTKTEALMRTHIKAQAQKPAPAP